MVWQGVQFPSMSSVYSMASGIWNRTCISKTHSHEKWYEIPLDSLLQIHIFSLKFIAAAACPLYPRHVLSLFLFAQVNVRHFKSMLKTLKIVTLSSAFRMGKILVALIIDLLVCAEEKATYNRQSKEVKIEWIDMKEYMAGKEPLHTKSAHMSQLDEPK